MDLHALLILLLNRLEEFSMGVPTALLTGLLSDVQIPTRGVLILLALGEDLHLEGTGLPIESPLPCKLFILHQTGAHPSAGEIQESLRRGLLETPFKLPAAYDLSVKFLRHEYSGHKAPNPEKGIPGLNTHVSFFELIVHRKDAA